MALTTNIAFTGARDLRADILARWDGASATAKARVKVTVLVVAVGSAYHYSLTSLLQTVGFDTPLAYVGLVPLLAAGLAWLRRRPAAGEPPIHDRQLDYIIGLPLVALAMGMVYILPAHLGDLYWVNRLDLLSLPVFVAGTVALLFGTRILWRQKVAVLYLFLAWPWPYTTILLGTLNGFTDVTLKGLTVALRFVHVARAVPGAANTGLYTVLHHGHVFPVDVVTACSGVDGMVGFFLVGAGFVTLVEGPVLRKLAWLLAGVVLLWATNLGRLLLIFWIGELAGEHVAIGEVHPIAGIVIFCLGIVLMMVMLRPFGLRFVDLGAAPAAGAAPRHAARQAAPRIFMAGTVIGLAGLLLAVNNSTLRSFDPVASASGAPKLASFIAHPPTPPGWEASYETQYTINKPLFGESSLWYRYLLTESPSHTNGDLGSVLPVTADVINAGGLSGFEEYGVTACYSFHGYELRDVAKVSLGNGVSGQALSWATPNGLQDWTIVYWILPVKMATTTRYERVILYLQNSEFSKVTVPGAQSPVQGLKGALTTSPADRTLAENRLFLVSFARQLIQAQTHQSDTTTTLATITTEHSGGVATTPVVAPGAHKASPLQTPAQRRAKDARIRRLERQGRLPDGTDGVFLRGHKA